MNIMLNIKLQNQRFSIIILSRAGLTPARDKIILEKTSIEKDTVPL